MIYLLYGTDNGLIKEFINKIKSDNEIKDVENYSLNETDLEEVINSSNYSSLFEDKKMIIVKDSSSLFEREDNILENYINNKNKNTFLIFVLEKETLDNRKKLTKLFKEKTKVLEFNKITNEVINEKIKSNFEEENYTIDNISIIEIINRCKNNYEMILNEIEKLKLYKINDKKVTLEDVKKVVPLPLEDDIFKLTNAVTSDDKKTVMKIVNDIISSGTDEIKIIAMLASDFRLMYKIKCLNEFYTEKEIVSILKVHPYRVKIMLEKVRTYSLKYLEEKLNNLSDLDYEIKSGVIDKGIGLELFLLS